VTYYVSSKLAWKDRGLSLTQTTDLPLSNKVTFTITAAPTDAVSLKFRKPDWTSTCQMAITVNGQPVTPVESGGFLAVSRVWQADDKVELAFPLLVQVSRLQDNQNAVAFTYGPIVLSAGLGTDAMTTTSHGVQVLKATKPTGLQDTIKINSGTINDWLANIQTNLVQTPGKLEFTLKGTDSDGKLVFIPHFSRYKDRYGIYWIMSGTAGGTATASVVCPALGGGGTGGAGGMDAGAGGNAGGATGGTGKGGAGGAGGVAGGSGGAQGSGGRTGTSTAAGGSQGSGGAATGTGGSVVGGAGGVQGSGGRSTSSASSGGAQASGGAAGGAGNPNGGSSHAGGAAGGSAGNATDPSSGCSCSLGRRASTNHWTLGLLFAVGLVAWRRRRQ
jgi:MYXO-CTERM domain-containing protein